jgi:hypothetical protein
MRTTNPNSNKVDNTKVGDIISVIFYQGTQGNVPISRAPSGKICLINMEITKPFIEYGSTWDCQVDLVGENKLIITPIQETATSAQNATISASKANELLNKDWNRATGTILKARSERRARYADI